MKKNLLVTGLPGTGKTTLIRKILDTLPSRVSVSGFFTAEIRESGERVGFADVTHFSRIFKKLESQSAAEYRNSLAE